MPSHDDICRVEQAQRLVPRGRFVPPELRARADEDGPLPIGFNQTISQPSLVAFMTAQLALTPSSRVLEIGTGSGYQTALLAKLADKVFSIERIPELSESARLRFIELGCENISLRVGDGTPGWPEAAPFDAIIVTAAAREIPPALPVQLKLGGRLVVPVGEPAGEQMLVLVEKTPAGELRRRELFPVRFVPLVSDEI